MPRSSPPVNCEPWPAPFLISAADGSCGEGVRDGRDAQIVFGRGYDHNFALDAGADRGNPSSPRDWRTRNPAVCSRCSRPSPGVQVYTGNFLDGTLRR